MILSNISNTKQTLAFSGFISTQILILIASKFESELSPTFNFLQLLLVLALYVSLNQINFELIPKLINPKILFLVIAGFHLTSILLTQIHQFNPYLLWSKFGFGTMYLHNKIFVFGDLAHLTSWATCKAPIEIGSAICDPFLRPSNQNPHVLDFFRYFHLSNLIVIGFVFISTFYVLFFFLMKSDKSFNFRLLIVSLSPTVVLALERNNEVLTIILIFLGLILIEHKKKQILGSFLLVLASFFKLWPVLVVILILFLAWKKLSNVSKLILISGIFYWIVFLDNLLSMREFTQNGTYTGGSFGFQLFFLDRITRIWFSLFLLGSLTLIIFLVKNIKEIKVNSSNELATLSALFISYIIIWFSSNNWSYRLLILLPILYILSKSNFPKSFINKCTNLILATLLTTQLSVTIFMTSILSIYFILFILINFNSIKNNLFFSL
jgi:hypothetical protein